MTSKAQAIDGAVRAVTACIHTQATATAEALNMSAQDVESAMWDSLMAARPRDHAPGRDKRAVPWRVRIQVFNPGGELEADSDGDAPADSPATTLIDGLPSVADWLRRTVHAFHFERGDTVQELDTATLNRRMKSLRPVLSRNGGAAAWRIPYQVNGMRWLVIANVTRVQESEG